MTMDEAKINKLLETLEEVNVLLQRAMLTCSQAEKELKVRLNDRFDLEGIRH